jgi:hypothetical protein
MPKAKDEVLEEKGEKAADKAGTAALAVYNASGQYVRTYTPDQTDENKTFVEKAEGFAKKIGGEVRKAD